MLMCPGSRSSTLCNSIALKGKRYKQEMSSKALSVYTQSTRNGQIQAFEKGQQTWWWQLAELRKSGRLGLVNHGT